MVIEQISGIGTRSVNEDAIGYTIADGLLCAVVCDGLGGHDSGEVASKLVRDTIISAFNANPSLNEAAIGSYIFEAQDRLSYAKQTKESYTDMMTTVSMIVTDGNRIQLAHVGDTRIYLYNRQKMHYKTRDHSVVAAMIARGELTPNEALHHEDRNKLIRVMGMSDDRVKYDFQSINRSTSNISHVVLCTDGFWENYSDKLLGKQLRWSSDYAGMLKRIDKKINKSRYFGDNYSAVVVAF